MKAKGCTVFLIHNKGFALPSNIGELGDDITELNLSECSLTGALGITHHTSFRRQRPITNSPLVPQDRCRR